MKINYLAALLSGWSSLETKSGVSLLLHFRGHTPRKLTQRAHLMCDEGLDWGQDSAGGDSAEGDSASASSSSFKSSPFLLKSKPMLMTKAEMIMT